MTFGISAGALLTTAYVATQAYASDKSRKAAHGQADAVNAARTEDARNAQNAEIQAQLDANARTAEARRRRRNSVLGGGDQVGTDLLGGPSDATPGTSALATRAAQLVAGIGGRFGTALGSGGGSSGMSARVAAPSRPSRESSV